MALSIDTGQSSQLLVEKCGYYRPSGFSTIAMAANSNIGRLCIVKQLDENNEKALTYVQFYASAHMPSLVFIWQMPLEACTIGCMTWLEDIVVLGCTDGSLLLVSPYEYGHKKVKIGVAEITALVSINDRLFIGTEAGDILYVRLDAEHKPIAERTQKFLSEQRIVSMDASAHLRMLAVGLLNEVELIAIETGERLNIKLNTSHGAATIIWSVLFVDDYLFVGDSRGTISIYTATSGNFAKAINTHEADILTISTNGESVFCAGIDYRIQVMKLQLTHNNALEWTTVGQRIIHDCDVRCLCSIGSWLVSAGAGHEVLVSRGSTLPHQVASKRGCSFTLDGRFMLMSYTTHVDIWRRGDVSIETFAGAAANADAKPQKLLSLRMSGLISFASLSPDGRNLLLLVAGESQLFRLEQPTSSEVDDDGEPEPLQSKRIAFDATAIDDKEPIVAACITKTSAFLVSATNSFYKLDLESAKITRVAKRHAKAFVTQLCVNADETRCLALTSRSEILSLNLSIDDLNERCERLEFTKAPSQIRFLDSEAPIAVVLVADYLVSLDFIDLRTREAAKSALRLSDMLAKNEIATWLSVIFDDCALVHGDRNSCILLKKISEPDISVLSTVAPPQHAANINNEERDRQANASYSARFSTEAYWLPAAVAAVAAESDRQPSRGIVALVSTQPKLAPKTKPANIRRFGRY